MPKSRTKKPAGAARRPAPADKKPEIILKQTWFGDCRGDTQRALPMIKIVANEKGLRHLAKLFERYADRAREIRKHGGGSWWKAEHHHLGWLDWDSEFNQKLSDELEFYIVPFSAKSRAAALKYNSISRKTAQRDDIRVRYPRTIDEIERDEFPLKPPKPAR